MCSGEMPSGCTAGGQPGCSALGPQTGHQGSILTCPWVSKTLGTSTLPYSGQAIAASVCRGINSPSVTRVPLWHFPSQEGSFLPPGVATRLADSCDGERENGRRHTRVTRYHDQSCCLNPPSDSRSNQTLFASVPCRQAGACLLRIPLESVLVSPPPLRCPHGTYPALPAHSPGLESRTPATHPA